MLLFYFGYEQENVIITVLESFLVALFEGDIQGLSFDTKLEHFEKNTLFSKHFKICFFKIFEIVFFEKNLK